jgi:hypothetical protein
MSQARSGSYLYPRVPRVRKAAALAVAARRVLPRLHRHARARLHHRPRLRLRKGRAPAARIVTRTVTPLTQWECSAHERREYIEACKRRAQSALIAPKE